MFNRNVIMIRMLRHHAIIWYEGRNVNRVSSVVRDERFVSWSSEHEQLPTVVTRDS